MGTTVIGVTYDGGVVLGADSRMSTGIYVANRASDKIRQLRDNVYVCRFRSAADSQIVSDNVWYFLHQHIKWKVEEMVGNLSVQDVSN
ncbi:proteasome subunit beta type-6-like [Elaeis guineensis]|uniref:proteasome subunit beta type-6-like n=1 Tax=Elaeis guineensis var. tenera TaxID=51953 RepID=UPI003C6DB6BF